MLFGSIVLYIDLRDCQILKYPRMVCFREGPAGANVMAGQPPPLTYPQNQETRVYSIFSYTCTIKHD